MSSARPLSVIDGRDPQVLQIMLDFYAPLNARVVDVTANRRRMWKGVKWSGAVTWCDLDPAMAPDVVADFRALPFDDASVDVLVFDPPHLPMAAGSVASLSQMKEDYGLAGAPKADNVESYFRPFLHEACRVLRPDGVVFAKLKDYVHNHRYQWMLVEWILAVRETEGLTPCDLIVKRDPCGGNLKSGRWIKSHHVRNAHCWWVVVRKGRCEAKCR
jgi:SAM-dependent methyltransferase